jgi:RNA polymerase sigma factor (sigma-70 family)
MTEQELFGQPLPYAPLSGGGLSKDDELLWFQRLEFARNQLNEAIEAGISNKIVRVWRLRVAHCRNFLTASNMALAMKLVNNFCLRSSANMSIKDDLQSSANEALVRAVDGFLLAKKVRFSSFAWLVIENQLFKTVLKETKARRRVVAATDYESKSEKKSKLLCAPDHTEMTVAMTDNAELIAWAMSHAGLSLAEQNVLDMRYRQNLKLREIGDVLSLTKERIRQIQEKGLGKLRGVIEAEMN